MQKGGVSYISLSVSFYVTIHNMLNLYVLSQNININCFGFIKRENLS